MRILQVPAGTVVVGVVGPSSSRALAWAVGESVRTCRDLTLVHGVGSDGDGHGGLGPSDVPRVSDRALAAGRQALDDARALVVSLAPALRVREVLRLSGPRWAVMDLAAGASLVVLGGAAPAGRPVRDASTARYLLAHAPCPVVVVPGDGCRGDLALAG